MTGHEVGPTLRTDDAGWLLTERGWEADRSVAVGSNFLAGNGYLGYRGTTPEQGPDEYVALVVTDTYDCADGHWRELTTAPNPLFVAASIEGTIVAATAADEVETTLDLRSGTVGARIVQRVGEATVTIDVERFASYDDLHVLAQRWTLRSDREVVVDVDARIDDRIWSLNGTHLPEVRLDTEGDVRIATATTVDSGVEIVTLAHLTGPTGTATVAAGDELVVETAAVVMTSNDVDDPGPAARARLAAAAAAGYDALASANTDRWREIWETMDVVVEGDVVDQVGLRFSAYHNRICTPAHTDRLPIGARGLSCQAYQGAAFWDQEVYNLPPFLWTEPDIARSILVYRHLTLDGARRKAARLGYDGAYFAWISGDTGDELCPDVFFTDVLTGRPIRNHFNDWQMHVAPD
ncbi:MAG: glycoside hydrolase family 65 protein, partial [Actinomycetota bacterium]